MENITKEYGFDGKIMEVTPDEVSFAVKVDIRDEYPPQGYPEVAVVSVSKDDIRNMQEAIEVVEKLGYESVSKADNSPTFLSVDWDCGAEDPEYTKEAWKDASRIDAVKVVVSAAKNTVRWEGYISYTGIPVNTRDVSVTMLAKLIEAAEEGE